MYSLLSIFVILIARPVSRHCRYQPFDLNNFKRLSLWATWVSLPTPPLSISDDRHDDESSKLELRRLLRPKHTQLRNISSIDLVCEFTLYTIYCARKSSPVLYLFVLFFFVLFCYETLIWFTQHVSWVCYCGC